MKQILLISLFILAGCSKNNQEQTELPTFQTSPLAEISYETYPDNIDFGIVDGSSETKSIKIINNSNNEIANLSDLLLSHSNFDIVLNQCNKPLPPGKNCSIFLKFSSKNLNPGEIINESLIVNDLEIPLIATVSSLTKDLIVSPAAINLSSTVKGSRVEKVIKVFNPATTAINIEVSGLTHSRIISNSCNSSLPSLRSCYIRISLDTKNLNEGSFLETLNINNKPLEISAQILPPVPGQAQLLVNNLEMENVVLGSKVASLIKVFNQGTASSESLNVNTPSNMMVLVNSCVNGVLPGRACYIRVASNINNLGESSDIIQIGNIPVNISIKAVSNLPLGQVEVLGNTDPALVNSCHLININLKDSANNQHLVGNSRTVSFSGIATYSDANCQSSISSKNIEPYQSSTQVYISSATSGVKNLLVSTSSIQGSLSKTFYETLTVSSNFYNLIVGQELMLSTTGGLAPIVYEKISGLGSLSNQNFTAGVTAGTVQIKISDAAAQEQIVSINVVEELSSNISSFEKIINQSEQLMAIGGLPPYTYEKISGPGSVDNNGLYLATGIGSVSLKIKDSLNQEVIITGEIYSNLSTNISSFEKVINQTQVISGLGGKAPYQYSKISGVGNIDSNGLYSAGNTPGSVSLRVRDALNQEIIISGQIYSQLTASVSSFEKIVNQTQNILGIGGKLPYTYSKISGVGSIDVNGLYSAGASPGIVSLKIVDSLNQEVFVSGQVYSQLSISPSSITLALTNSQTFSGVGGKPPYVYEKVSGVGVINSSTGVYSSSNTGSAQVKVKDSLDQEATALITINSNIVVSAGTCSYSTPEQVDCQVSSTGGVGVKTYSTNQGVINSSSGIFYGICSNNTGQSIITATDELGNTGQVTLNYPCVYKSCNQILLENYGSTSALYWLDFDQHRGGLNPQQYYCDMTFGGEGGWMLVSSNSSSSTLIPGGVARNNDLYQLDRTSTLGNPDPNSDYIIGSSINSAEFDQVKIVAFGATTGNPEALSSSYPSSLGTHLIAKWNLTSTGSSRLSEVVPRANVSISGNSTLSNFANYFVLDAVKKDSQNSGYNANSNQSTVGGAGTQTISGDPAGGAYLGHGSTEGSYEGWYYTDSAIYNSKGYTTWVKGTYYKYPRSCADAQARGALNQNGLAASGNFIIDPDGYSTGLAQYTVYCDFQGNTSTLNASGGNITYDGNYKIHTFSGPGSYQLTVTQGSGTVEYLVVAGGGGGGGRSGGGGGAGGLRTGFVSISSNVAVTVGAGGPGGAGTGTIGTNGQNSSFGSIISLGGGGGAGDVGQTGYSGGSGGGGKYGNLGSPGTAGQGNAGGSGTANSWAAGGGGGASTPGVNGVQGKCGNGGAGFGTSISGAFVTYAGGGGGGSHNPEPGYGSPCSRGLGGLGGGGAGGIPGGKNPGVNGTDGLGGGGGGGSTDSSNGGAGGNGGSGVVIIRYQYKL